MEHHAVLPRRDAVFAEPALPLPSPVRSALADHGITRLYSHQARALDTVRRGENAVLATSTASGKSLAYQLPLLEAVLDDPRACALGLYPLKALEQDQHRAAEALAASLGRHAPGCNPRAAIYDGDTTPHRRRKIRDDHPNFLITNPDMLHLGILPHHPGWEGLFRKLRYVVIDELHAYRGIFGSHIAQVLRRLIRVARYYGASPQFIACSATIQNPGELAAALTGLPFTVVDADGAAAAERHLAFVNPEGSPTLAAARLFSHAVRAGHKTIAFTKSRKVTELMHAWTLEEDPELAGRISAYRSGYLREERREIEARLKSGDLWGVISTSALELGIDIGELDVCILVGYPGSIVNTWQRGGRVGRSGRASAVLMVAQPDALDQYLVRHPEEFLRRTFERAVIDPENIEILGPHLVCAAAEAPLRSDEPLLRSARAAEAVASLEQEGRLLRSATGREWFATARRPHAGVDIRGAGERYAILDERAGDPIGTVAGPRVLAECHEGAIYLHRGRQYRVGRLDLDAREVHARPAEVSYYTRPRGREETEILSVDRSIRLRNFIVRLGRLKVTSWVTGYEKRRILGQALLSTHPLSLPPSIFETVGAWIDIPEDIERLASDEGFHFLGSLHAMEHAAISLFPIFALCDPDDIGGLSYPRHPQLGRSAVFFYDGQAGGVGLCASVFERLDATLEATLELVGGCPCESGCPSCVQSARCGSGNRPMDKAGAGAVLELLLGRRAQSIRVFDQPPQLHNGETAAPQNAIPTAPPEGRRVIFFDLETQLSAEEVGGWEKAHLMRLAVGVIYDSREGRYEHYGEAEVQRLLDRLREADLVVGFNVLRFDYAVLGAYAGETLSGLPTFDILGDIHRTLGFRLSLGHLAEQTLGTAKAADGLDSLRWWREGRVEEVAAYCEQDVEITRRLFEHGAREHHVIFERRDGQRVKLPVSWDVESILRARAAT
ncbi:MAG: DEAD/DEAH box helicase [Deltaproteobacteria bacterium]|nr:DEAD/DEAH box helicase [Deltaproteobacteria bacterium]